jgi:outer membrane lipoprotein carrier protein
MRRTSNSQSSNRDGKTSSKAFGGVIFASAALLLFGASASPAFAQAPQASLPSAIEIAHRVDEHYNHLQSLKSSFTEQYEGMGISRTESGTMLLRKPGKMRWDYTGASGKTGKLFVLDGKYAWFYAPGDSQVQRIPASKLDDLRSPLRFLLGHTKIESELEGLKLTSDSSGKSASYILTGIPKGQQKRIAKLTLSVSATGAIQDIVIQELDGARTEFKFAGEEANPAIPETEFHFTPPAGVPVVDMLPPV